jgi:hypothetical protein
MPDNCLMSAINGNVRERRYQEESVAVSDGGLQRPTPSILRVARDTARR